MTTNAYTRIDIPLAERSYPIVIGSGLLSDAGTLNQLVRAKVLLIVSNTTVAPLYLSRLSASLTAGRKISVIELPDGESHKTLATASTILDSLVGARMNRDAAVVALGGGVVGDTAGFAAACYQRGIDFVQVPTTLLAQVDSSVGGKTGVNHPLGKNLIGAFHQPQCVLIDVSTLETLPKRELQAGLAEVIKYGFIRDLRFLEWLEENVDRLLARDPATLTYAIRRSCEIKAEVVGIDEREQGLRAILNFGHTFGHAIETAVGYGEWLHGEAVGTGMVLATQMSERLGWIDAADRRRVENLIRRVGLPERAPRIGAQKARELMGMDKKVLDGKLRLVLLKPMGTAVVTSDYAADAFAATLVDGFA
jgi:3-dehydroquinate synthase